MNHVVHSDHAALNPRLSPHFFRQPICDTLYIANTNANDVAHPLSVRVIQMRLCGEESSSFIEHLLRSALETDDSNQYEAD